MGPRLGRRRVLGLGGLAALALVGCGQPSASRGAASPAAAPTSAPATTAPAVPTTAAAAPTSAANATAAPVAATATADLGGVKRYLQENGESLLKAGAEALKADANKYYAAVKAANFDYRQAWGDGAALRPLILDMRAQFNTAHTGYENVEGIVAGVPSLSEFDTILDAGSPGSEGGDNVADYRLTLPDGATLDQPGNHFHSLLEPMIYGTDPAMLKLTGVDVDGDGAIGFGDGLPDANLLKGVADSFVHYVDETLAAIAAWRPTAQDAFMAMATMTPTMAEYFDNWKESRFVSGESSTETAFVAHSRLVDVLGILTSLRTIYAGVQPLVMAENPALAQQIDRQYADLFAFVQDLHAKEQAGDAFTPDQAGVLGADAQAQAEAITGQVTQAAAVLGIELAA